MSKAVRLLLILTCIAALLICGLRLDGYAKKQAQLHQLQEALAVSMEHWQTVAAEKEAMEAELAEVNNALKEADLTLKESTDRAATLETEIEALQAEIEALQAK